MCTSTWTARSTASRSATPSELPRDTAFNFASDATRVAQKHGLHPKFGAITRVHKEYDAMFEDIRAKLHAHPGEPVDLERIIRHE